MENDNVARIKDALDIVEIIGEKVTLRKVGKNYRGLCPFHSEKTPSFYVSPERQRYHCFGCGAGGDLFTFVMESEGLTFKEALEMLASRSGITLEQASRGGRKARDIRELLEETRRYYSTQLHAPGGKRGREYLASRSLSAEDARTFGLGWAGESWNGLEDHLKKEGFSLKDALETGVLVSGTRGTYDRFRGRLIFPIADAPGRTIAFGGRLVGAEGAKYVNSPEGPLFSKRHVLYLLSRARGALREKGEALLVEGYMDALRLHLSGFPESVASLGTALSEEQGELLHRFVNRVYVCYDADAAGQEAALRGMYILQSRGLDVRIVTLPPGEDPDSLLLRKEGREAFLACRERAVPLISYHLRLRQKALQDSGERSRAAEEILEKIVTLPSFEVSSALPEIASAFGMFPHEAAALLEEYRKKEEERRRSFERKKEKSPPPCVYKDRGEDFDSPEALSIGQVGVLEAGLLYLLRERGNPSREEALKALSLFPEGPLRTLGVAFLQEEDREELETRWLAMGDMLPFQIIEKGAAFCEELEEDEESWVVVCRSLLREREKREYGELKRVIARNEATPEELQRFLVLGKRLKKGGS